MLVREAGAGADGEVVTHQEWAKIAEVLRPHRAAHPRTCTLGLLDGLEDLSDGAGGAHVCCEEDLVILGKIRPFCQRGFLCGGFGVCSEAATCSFSSSSSTSAGAANGNLEQSSADVLGRSAQL